MDNPKFINKIKELLIKNLKHLHRNNELNEQELNKLVQQNQ